jgi:hypothetical protein
MSKRKARKLILLFVLFSTILSCNFNNRNAFDFENWKKKQFERSFIKFINDKVIFYDGIPIDDNLLEGKLTQEHEKVYFKSEDLRFLLFDFAMPIHNCIPINYKKKALQKKEYLLCKQDVFFDKSYNDSIYKFCFKNYQIFNKKNGVVYFVSKKNGILGCYLVDYSASDTIPAINEVMYGEVFRNRYDYNKFLRFTIK